MDEIALTGDRERFAKPLFLITVVVGSFLLFLTQPMVARMALPRVGGAPAVWNSAMLVYQALLLAGYAYAHWLSRLKPRRQAVLHLVLFALAGLWLPIGLRPDLLPADAEPALWVPWFLVASIGPLFFIVATQAPLMQRWYALETKRGEPYPLYAASNLGSFAGLIAYPLLVEPVLPLAEQSVLWTVGYGLLVLLVAGCALTIPAGAVEQQPQDVGGRPPATRTLYWIVLAAVPSGLMLSTTTHLTTDIVAMPLLWVLPLGLYLLSFAVAFSTRQQLTKLLTLLVPPIMLVTGILAFSRNAENPLYSATFELMLLFGVAVALHGEMYRLRPAPAQLTHFYLAMAVGGMVGGIFCAIIAPIIFDWSWEYPLLVVAAGVLVPQRPLLARIERIWQSRAGRWLVFGIPMVALGMSLLVGSYVGPLSGRMGALGGILIILLTVFSIGRGAVYGFCLMALMLCYGGWRSVGDSLIHHNRTRSYFGIYTIEDYGSHDRYRTLKHGTTLHGIQNLAPGRGRDPTTYYAPRSGIGLAMRQADFLYGQHARIGVVGLGTGTLSCYARPGQDWRFFEIDPAMDELATRSGSFTFFQNCAPTARILIGDARLTLARQSAAGLDLLAVDAFSSDSVPMHLLTREAFDVYAHALQPSGLLLVHVSNRYIDLKPVVAAAARGGHWQAVILNYAPTDLEGDQLASHSIWIALSRDRETIDRLTTASQGEGEWNRLRPRPDFAGWSDDFASILPLLKREGFLPARQ
jgi:spermidine synthase